MGKFAVEYSLYKIGQQLVDQLPEGKKLSCLQKKLKYKLNKTLKNK